MKVLKLLLIFALAFCIHAQDLPTNVWCDYTQIPDPTSLPFNFTQPIWWQEYFLLNATGYYNLTVTFKAYANIISDAYMQLILAVNYCPVFTDSPLWPNSYGPGIANLTYVSNITEGDLQIVLFSHMSGSSYTIFACNGTVCPQMCPGDCSNDGTTSNGFCNVTTRLCTCYDGWLGEDCSVALHNTTTIKVPFGSWGLFYSIVVGFPALFIATIISVVAIVIFDFNLKRKMVSTYERRPLLSSKSNYGTKMNGNANGNGLANGKRPHSISAPYNGIDAADKSS